MEQSRVDVQMLEKVRQQGSSSGSLLWGPKQRTLLVGWADAFIIVFCAFVVAGGGCAMRIRQANGCLVG
jgi:hypothetical protein